MEWKSKYGKQTRAQFYGSADRGIVRLQVLSQVLEKKSQAYYLDGTQTQDFANLEQMLYPTK